VDAILGRASLAGILEHKLGPLAANRLRRIGEPVPEGLRLEERAAVACMLTAIPLVERIRSSCEGPLVLLKGAEVARLYPGGARRFGDIDILADDARAVKVALVGQGFVELDDPSLKPFKAQWPQTLGWPNAGLDVDVHKAPTWPSGLRPPSTRDIIDASRPSALGVAGLSAPAPHHHALILAAHAWGHEPLWKLRDLIDIEAVSTQADEQELNRTATAWGIARLWRTTQRTIDAVLYGGRETLATRTWARHLEPVRERNRFETSLTRLVHAYWAMPPQPALVETMRAVRYMIEPEPSDTSRRRVARIKRFLRAPAERSGPR